MLAGILLLGALITALIPAAVQAQTVEEPVESGYDFRLEPAAEATPVTVPDETDISADAVPEEPAAPAAPASATPTASVEEGFDFKLQQMPPLPFAGPNVTPAAEVATDDVDLRTTAFSPVHLDRLTPIDPPAVDGGDRWIRVDLSEQMVIAYEGQTPVRGFIVSTGLPGTPTVTGTFRIRLKVRSQTMTGGSRALGTYYNLANVQWVQYFYSDYSFHGTYWHNNFGNPMSHGCINMTNADAKWLFDWAGPTWDGKTTWYSASEDNPGTLVMVTE
jgi:lipoprotein-anchoring transpeptidase ErfK/SrfK